VCAESVFVQKKLGALDNRPVGPAIANNNALIYPCELKDNAYIWHPLWMQKVWAVNHGTWRTQPAANVQQDTLALTTMFRWAGDRHKGRHKQ